MGAERQVLWDVLEEHLDEAGFLWQRWELALVSPQLLARQVDEGDEARLLAHVEGLAVGGSAAADGLLEAALREGEAGEVSAAALALLARPDGLARLRAALVDGEAERREAATRALALSRGPAERALVALLDDGDPAVVAAALEALAFRRLDPGPILLRFLASEDAALAAPALRAAPSSSQPVRALVERAMGARDGALKRSALEAALRLGFRAALPECRRLVEAGDPCADRALAMLAQGGDPADVPRLTRAVEVKSLRASALIALGYCGRAGVVDVLLAAMEGDARSARLAGEAFSAITGVPIAGELVAEDREQADEPVSFEDEDLDLDLLPGPEAELPLPDPSAVARAWSARKAASGTR